MTTNRQTRQSPRLVLYGIVFRLLCNVALRGGDQARTGELARVPTGERVRAPMGEPVRAPRQPDPCHSPLRKERAPVPLNLDPGQ